MEPLDACPTLSVACLPSRVSIVVDQLLRLLHHCGMPTTDVDLLHGSGLVMNHIIREAEPRNVLFTGEAETSWPYCCSYTAELVEHVADRACMAVRAT